MLRLFGVSFIVVDKNLLSEIPVRYRKCGESILHYLANNLILKKVKICLSSSSGVLIGHYKGINILNPVKHGLTADAIITKKDVDCMKDITVDIYDIYVNLLPKRPVFIIDLSLWELHHEKERLSLLKQLAVSIDIIRRWLTDLNLILSSTPLEIIKKLQKLMPMAIKYYTTSEIYNLIDPAHTVILDPYADDTLSESDVFNYDHFIIGGIIDKLFPRPYATYMIYKMHSLNVARKSIRIRGSVIGVPNEINKVIDIVLRTRLGGVSLEEAVIKNMDIGDKISRILYEVTRHLKTHKHIDIAYVKRLMESLDVGEEYLPRILAKLKKFISS